MKRIFLIKIVIICLLLSACSSEYFQMGSSPTGASSLTPSQQTDPAKTEPSETDTTDPYALGKEELAVLQNSFENGFYNIALGQTYSDPREIDLFLFFYNGDSSDWIVTDTEHSFIQSAIQYSEYIDIYRASPENMDAILQMCFGLSFADMQGNGLKHFAYFEQTGCYYVGATAPPLHAEFLKITSGTHMENGNLQVSYEAGGTSFVMILKPVDGGYHILSNLKFD